VKAGRLPVLWLIATISALQFFGRCGTIADIRMRWSPEGSVANDPWRHFAAVN
jgi:hypothetical protein